MVFVSLHGVGTRRYNPRIGVYFGYLILLPCHSSLVGLFANILLFMCMQVWISCLSCRSRRQPPEPSGSRQSRVALSLCCCFHCVVIISVSVLFVVALFLLLLLSLCCYCNGYYYAIKFRWIIIHCIFSSLSVCVCDGNCACDELTRPPVAASLTEESFATSTNSVPEIQRCDIF